MDVRSPSKPELVERVKVILNNKGLTLYQVSQWTRRFYGRSAPYFLPHNLYYELELGTFSPSLYQLFALSRISGYRLHDWLRVFGFNPEEIARLQVRLLSKRTVLLDSSLDDPESWVVWFRNKSGGTSPQAIAPIGQILDLALPRRIRAVSQARVSNFVYAKIGIEDAFAFPELLPGSIVRANTRTGKAMLPTKRFTASESFFLIEHAGGLCCCRLQAVGSNRIMPVSPHLPYAQVELQVPDEARVLGIVDLEIRPLVEPTEPDVPKELARHWRPLPLGAHDAKLSHLLRHARLRTGLSFRDASAMSRHIARELADSHYFAASGSLSDYEAVETPPRHIHKAITLCVIYGLQFSTFLKSVGLDVEEAGKDPIPDSLVPRKVSAGSRDADNETNERDEATGNGFLEQLLNRSQAVPFFLRDSISDLCGLKNHSLHDFFWVGGDRNPLHPLLVNGLLVAVNRHKKKPSYSRSKPPWQQPLYMLLRRDGTYVCGCCSLEDDTLVMHPYPLNHQRPEQLRNHHDAEVVGQIVAVVRSM